MKKINTLQFSTSVFNIFVSAFFGLGIYTLIKISFLDSIISLLISIPLTIILLFIFITIFDYEKELNFKEKIKKLFNKPFSYVLMGILSICFLYIGVCYFYDINNFIISQFLSETPIYITGITLAILIIYVNNKGFEVISRVSLILCFINLILLIIGIMGSLRNFDINNLKPMFQSNTISIIKGSINILFFSFVPVFIMLMIPKNSIIANEKTNKGFIISIILGYLFMFIILILTLGILGINLANLYQYPAYMIFKRINIFNILDRVENLIITQWFFQVYIVISYIVYFIHKITNLKNYIITFSILIISLVLFVDNTFYYQLTTFLAPYISGIIILIMFIIFFKIKRKSKLS